MLNKKLLAAFEIPEYLREVQVSQKQRPKYYEYNGQTIKAKGKKLLQKYINPYYKDMITLNNGNIEPYYLRYPYFIATYHKRTKKVLAIYAIKDIDTKKFKHGKNAYTAITDIRYKPFNTIDINKDTKRVLINVETKQRVIANETQAGKPKKIIIKGQDMYSGVLNEFTRAKIVNELKEDYGKRLYYINNLYKLNPNIVDSNNTIKDYFYPIYVELEVVDTIKNYYDRAKEGDGIRWDVGNRAYPYLKTFVDFLVESEVIIDDDRLHVKGEGYYFTPCNRHEDRKLIFRIYKV